MPPREAITKRWYVVHARPRQEAIAKVNLERQGYDVYLPMARQEVIRSRRLITHISPLFPRYLFIHLDECSDNWSPIRSTRGVTTLVRFGHAPAMAPDALIEMLKAREGPDGFHEIASTVATVGDRVRIEGGPMAGYEGIFLAPSGRERVLVLLDIMGKQVRLNVDAALVALAS